MHAVLQSSPGLVSASPPQGCSRRSNVERAGEAGWQEGTAPLQPPSFVLAHSNTVSNHWSSLPSGLLPAALLVPRSQLLQAGWALNHYTGFKDCQSPC